MVTARIIVPARFRKTFARGEAVAGHQTVAEPDDPERLRRGERDPGEHQPGRQYRDVHLFETHATGPICKASASGALPNIGPILRDRSRH